MHKVTGSRNSICWVGIIMHCFYFTVWNYFWHVFICQFIGPSAGKKLHGITNAVENYHTVLSENRRLYNEVQDLKGATVWYCSIYLNY